MLDTFCAAVEMKEKKRVLYDEAMKACPDQVGVETFRMLRDSEVEQLKKLQQTYEELKKGKASADACTFQALDGEEGKSALRKLAAQGEKMPKACLDDVAAIETGMKLEDASIQYFTQRLDKATDPLERKFLTRMIREEREHYIVLADLKFYYVDPEHWFMEKAGDRLDGAGPVT
jgi:rubrerythrin